jgi:hypothetical protein
MDTFATGVSGNNVVGYYADASGAHGFLYNGSSFTTLNGPDSLDTDAHAYGIDGNNVVGIYRDANGFLHGFLFNGSYTTLNGPAIGVNGLPPTDTQALAVSGNNVVGVYYDPGTQGFLYNGSSYTTLVVPGAGMALPLAVSGNNVVGYYGDQQSPGPHGFLYDGSSYTTLDPPGATDGTFATGVSGNIVVGYYTDASGAHGFRYNGSSFTTLDVPGAVETFAFAVSGNNVVGDYYNSYGGAVHAFLYNGSTYTNLDVPGAIGTIAQAVSGNNVVGYYFDANDNFSHGFLATVSAVTPTVTLTAANATYTGSPYAIANLNTVVTPPSASGSVSYVFYSDAGGQNVIATPINARTYYVRAIFTSSDPANFSNATSSIVPFTITATSLSVHATTQGTINIAKAGTISFALQITAGLVASNNNVVSLFNGATFTITVGGTSYSLTSAATVAANGSIHVSMKMGQDLQNALLTALSKGNTVDFSLSALSNNGDYSVAADAISRLISQGKLKKTRMAAPLSVSRWF